MAVESNAKMFSLAPGITFPNSGVTPTAAHIHEGVAGATGGLVIGFTLDTVAGTGTIDDTLTDPQITLFESDSLYVNLHTADNTGGELRGQIIP